MPTASEHHQETLGLSCLQIVSSGNRERQWYHNVKQQTEQSSYTSSSGLWNYMLHMHVLGPDLLSISCIVASVGTILAAAIVVLRWHAVTITILCRCAVAVTVMVLLIANTFLLHCKV